MREGWKFQRGSSTTRHLSIHLVLHVRGWRAAADHAVRGHVVAVRRLRWGPALIHSARAHGHILSGRLQANTRENKNTISGSNKKIHPIHQEQDESNKVKRSQSRC